MDLRALAMPVTAAMSSTAPVTLRGATATAASATASSVVTSRLCTAVSSSTCGAQQAYPCQCTGAFRSTYSSAVLLVMQV
jgi:hypothetical protein